MSRGTMRKRGPESIRGEHGFTLIEVMFGIVLLTFGLLAVADVFPQGLALGRYGKDQTTAANLAQQQIEFLKSQATTSGTCPATPIAQTATAALKCLVGDYHTSVATACFDQGGNAVTCPGLGVTYLVRDVQIQYWTWNPAATPPSFTLPSSPYTAPSGTCPPTCYVFRVSVATYWAVRGQTAFTFGNTTSPNGCVNGGAQATTGIGCIQVSTFITP